MNLIYLQDLSFILLTLIYLKVLAINIWMLILAPDHFLYGLINLDFSLIYGQASCLISIFVKVFGSCFQEGRGKNLFLMIISKTT